MAAMESPEPPLVAVVKSINDFTVDLYLTTAKAKGPGTDVLVSPLSAALVTAMVHAGAKGETASEIERGLRLPSDKGVLEDGFKALHSVLRNTPDVVLEIANRIYIDKTLTLKSDFKKTVSEVHNSELQRVDFKNNAEQQRLVINQWVSEKTHNNINDLLSEGTIHKLTRIFLVNAVYFFGDWKIQFNRRCTIHEDFFVSKYKTVKVPMMHLTANLRYAVIPKLKAKAVELCYANTDFCLQIILPDAKDGLEAMQKQLRKGAFDLSETDFYTTDVRLSMPKFKLEDTIDIQGIYQQMGLTKMFLPSDDFGGMIEGTKKHSVSGAVQKTFMDVNEKGTEAAAATYMNVPVQICLKEPEPPPPPTPFEADHPFLVVLAVRAVPPARRPPPRSWRESLFDQGRAMLEGSGLLEKRLPVPPRAPRPREIVPTAPVFIFMGNFSGPLCEEG